MAFDFIFVDILMTWYSLEVCRAWRFRITGRYCKISLRFLSFFFFTFFIDGGSLVDFRGDKKPRVFLLDLFAFASTKF